MARTDQPTTGRISAEEHAKHDWRVHNLLADFDIEDVWLLPITLSKDDKIESALTRIGDALENITTEGLPGALFKIRLKMGDVLGWDQETSAIRELPPGSLRERWAKQENLSVDQMPLPRGDDGFRPVYVLEDESLDELDNATVHAGLHFGKVPLPEGGFGVQMVIYVKPKGTLGKLYMAGIKPFRHWIVYPALLRHMERSLG